MLYNNQSKFTTAVVSIDPAKRNLIKNHPSGDVYQFVKDKFSAFINDSVYKGIFQPKWIPKTFFISPEPFNEDNQMVNSTLKMVRYKITERYKTEIDSMYEKGGVRKIDSLNLKTLKG